MAFFQDTATNYQNLLDKIRAAAVNRHVATVAVHTAGTGYVVGDILTIAGGTVQLGLSGKILVTSVSGGGITGVKVYTAGAYSVDPATLTDNAVTGGTGSGGKVTITMSATGWTTQRYASSGSPTEYEWIALGTGSGADSIYAGIRTYRDVTTGAFNWELGGFTGYNGANSWEDQPGWSNKSTYVPLANSSIGFWISITPRRMVGVFRIGTTYSNMYLGFGNPFATPSQYPYPLYVGGCSSRKNRLYSTSNIFSSGLVDPIGDILTSSGEGLAGPHAVYFTDGHWYEVLNSSGATTTRTIQSDRNVYPAGLVTPPVSGSVDDFLANPSSLMESWQSVIPNAGVSPTANHNFQPTPDTGGDKTTLVPTVVCFVSPSKQILMELDSVYWLSAIGNSIVSEDTVTIGSEIYYCFQNCNRTDAFAFVALKMG